MTIFPRSARGNLLRRNVVGIVTREKETRLKSRWESFLRRENEYLMKFFWNLDQEGTLPGLVEI